MASHSPNGGVFSDDVLEAKDAGSTLAAENVSTLSTGKDRGLGRHGVDGVDEVIQCMKQLHQEVMHRLDTQDGMLRRAADPVQVTSIEIPSLPTPTISPPADSTPENRPVSKASSFSSSSQQAKPSSRDGDADENKDSLNPYHKVCTYTSFDMQLKNEAHSYSGHQSRQQFAEIAKQGLASEHSFRLSPWNIARHPRFDVFFAGVVCSNAVFIGVDLQERLANDGIQSASSQIIQHIFAGLFTLELFLRMLAFGRSLFHADDWLWSVLDIFIVLTSWWEVFVDVLEASGQDEVESIGGISSLKAFRIIRLTRILKTVRVIRLFRFVLALRTLVTSIFSTLKSLFWALMLLTLIVYVFAILFAQAMDDFLLDPTSPQLPDRELAASERYFGTLHNTMLSLFMSIAGGVSWEEVLGPLKAISTFWVALFLFYISFTYFAVLNVVTAVFCQSAIDSAQSDQAMMVQNILDDKQAHLAKIKALFSQLGAEKTGAITYETFEEKINSPAVRQYFQTLGLDVWDAWSFFKLLDQDAGGSVEIEEFLMGCLRLRGHATAIDVGKIMQDQTWIIENNDKFHMHVHDQLSLLRADMVAITVMLEEKFEPGGAHRQPQARDL